TTSPRRRVPWVFVSLRPSPLAWPVRFFLPPFYSGPPRVVNTATPNMPIAFGRSPARSPSFAARAWWFGGIKCQHGNELNQPLVTTGAGALPLPTGALPTQAVRPQARAIEQITINNFLIGFPL